MPNPFDVLCYYIPSPFAPTEQQSVMKDIVNLLTGLIVTTSWICGTVLAPGWYKLFATVFPPYAWYKVCEKVMEMYGVI